MREEWRSSILAFELLRQDNLSHGFGCRPIHNKIIRLGALIQVVVLLAMACDCDQQYDNVRERKGEPLSFEAFYLGLEEPAFKNVLSESLNLDRTTLSSTVECRDQAFLGVPHFKLKKIEERPAGDHRLTYCSWKKQTPDSTDELIEIRADFLDGRLVKVSFRYPASNYSAVENRIAKRLGPGGGIAFAEQMDAERVETEYHYWMQQNELWLLSRVTAGHVLLTYQDLKVDTILPASIAASKKGQPVSLEDIGIGSPDLDAPLPEIPKVILTDAGPGEK